MDILLAVKVIIMGVVEGLTEFLPVSSTGHLILAGSLLKFSAEIGRGKAEVFDIAIQAGAILAVCWEYRLRIAAVLSGLTSQPDAQKLVLNLSIASWYRILFGVIILLSGYSGLVAWED